MAQKESKNSLNPLAYQVNPFCDMILGVLVKIAVSLKAVRNFLRVLKSYCENPTPIVSNIVASTKI
eukprot:704593-Amphidinium_carterae.1